MWRIELNADEGVARTILSGYFKYGAATLIGGGLRHDGDGNNGGL